MIDTAWGYKLIDAETMPDIMTVTDFESMSDGRFVGDMRIAPNLAALGAQIRMACGWHIYPELACEITLAAHSKRIYRDGCDIVIQLPARYVSDVETVKIDGELLADTYCAVNGLLRLYSASIPGRRSKIEVTYKAGMPEATLGDLKYLLTNGVARALGSSQGVASETAGGVSVTYAGAWSSANASSLIADNAVLLSAYRLKDAEVI